MTGERINRSLVISAVGHAAVLLWCLVTFAAKPAAGPQDSIEVELISEDQLSRIMAGTKNAPRAEKSKPLVEKVAEPTPPPEDPALKVTDKQEVKTATAEPAPPSQPKQEARKESKEQTPTEQKTEPVVAEAAKKEQKKPPEKKVESKPPKPPKELPKFDPVRTAMLLDKRDPQRHVATGEVVNSTPALGLPRATAMTLSQSEIDSLRAQIEACFSMPAAAADAKNLTVDVRITLNQDGTLSSAPVVTNRGSGLFQIVAENLTRAIRRCAPYKLPIAKYEAWKDVDVSFDPRDMRG